MQGWRISMEDAHAAVLDLKQEGEGSTNGENTANDRRLSFFGVYDGHGGDKVALYAGDHLHKIIAKQEAFKSGDYEKAIKDGFLATDRAILNGRRLLNLQFHYNIVADKCGSDPKYEEEVSGCTACVSLITGGKIYVVSSPNGVSFSLTKLVKGNAGDSRAVLGIKGRAKPMSFDHKPQNESLYASTISNGYPLINSRRESTNLRSRWFRRLRACEW